MTNLDKIQAVLAKLSTMCDDCLSSASMVKPRQAVNQQCRRLVQQGAIIRSKDFCPRCGTTKIVNRPIGELGLTKLSETRQVVLAPAAKDKPTFLKGTVSSDLILDAVRELASKISSGKTEVYNEFSLQHELGILLRNRLPERLVQFERNVSYFGLIKPDFEKREIDISIFDRKNLQLDAAIELKFPRNGQYPEQMFSFCKDIVFLEQLKSSGFGKAFFVVFAEDRLFYEGSQSGIYSFFRGGQELTGSVTKPTGRRDKTLTINGSYDIEWHEVGGSTKFAIVEVQ